MRERNNPAINHSLELFSKTLGNLSTNIHIIPDRRLSVKLRQQATDNALKLCKTDLPLLNTSLDSMFSALKRANGKVTTIALLIFAGIGTAAAWMNSSRNV